MTRVALIAITHQHAPFELLERVALDADGTRQLAVALVAHPTIDEAVVLSTCNRTELYVAGATPNVAAAIDILSTHTLTTVEDLARGVVATTDEVATRHLFRVAAGLESRVVGEGEILAQVRLACARAGIVGSAGPTLGALFRAAVSAARRVRRTDQGISAPSLAAIALAAVGPVETTLVVGAGMMAEAVVTELAARRRHYIVCARRPDAAADLARRPTDARPMEDLHELLHDVDLVVFATSARTALLRRAEVEAATSARRGRPLAILDLALPRNVDPTVAAVAGVQLVDLHSVAGDRGELHLRRGTAVVDAEHERYLTWLAGRAVGADIARLRSHVLERCLTEARGVEDVARRIAGAILHEPTLALKELARQHDRDGIRALLDAFGVPHQSASSPVLSAAS